ncbi:type II secretion system protein [Viridibacterium curvum]|uniref:Type II secretion system protein n=1 Tax=Viridibacterium curvum TaxID=1101404 RepID=A0ABP9R3G0_9RHOO
MHPTASERSRSQAGFTLIEMIVVIVITGILGAGIAIFIRRPMEGVMDATRRVALVDAADTALRRMRRDIQRALPNSVRVTQSGSTWYIEFLPVLTAGRYCNETDCGASPLNLSAGNTTLSFVGPAPSLSPIPSGTELAIYNLGTTGADAYASNNTSALSAIGASTVTIAAKTFPYASPGSRFQIISTPVSYACTSGGSLTRIQGYAKQASQPTSTPVGASTAVLASNIGACSVDYTQAAIDQNGLLYITLSIAQDGESVNLTHAMQVSNAP